MNHCSWPASVLTLWHVGWLARKICSSFLQDCGLSWMCILCIAWIKFLIEEKPQQKNVINTAVFQNRFHWHEMVKLLDGLLVLAVTFNGESIFLEQACEMHLRVAWGRRRLWPACRFVLMCSRFMASSVFLSTTLCGRLIKTSTFSPLVASFIS